MAKKRADQLLVERGLAESRALAQRLVMAGQVRAAGQLVPKPASMLDQDVALDLAKPPRYVSRGGEKLDSALNAFPFSVKNLICADVGASTGGFTDCLIQHGAAKVYAIDVGRGQLHWKLRQDPRVIVMEKQNARHLAALPELIELATVDTSFISLKILLPVVINWLSDHGVIIALIKPQFEAGRAQVSRGKGVIRDPEIHRQVLADILESGAQMGLAPQKLITSPIRGPKGNVEFLVQFNPGKSPKIEDSALIEYAMDQVVAAEESA
ncbi:MAG: TlyA family RNA methyltransferase [Chloroflexi bacterium]|nr:TlyA family RNA methyltransferase [Chloroflexota bacterium]MQC26044.1 TlyA family RNA methyltransferase [Chloroflexota bacterium]